MKRFDLTYKSYGSQSILIEWPSKIDKNILKDILRFKNVIEKSDIKEKVHINSAYNSILVIYVFTINNIYNEISILKSLYASKNTANEPTFKRWKIPVCYDDKYGIDLDVISLEKKYSKQEIISLLTYRTDLHYLFYRFFTWIFILGRLR